MPRPPVQPPERPRPRVVGGIRVVFAERRLQQRLPGASMWLGRSGLRVSLPLRGQGPLELPVEEKANRVQLRASSRRLPPRARQQLEERFAAFMAELEPDEARAFTALVGSGLVGLRAFSAISPMEELGDWLQAAVPHGLLEQALVGWLLGEGDREVTYGSPSAVTLAALAALRELAGDSEGAAELWLAAMKRQPTELRGVTGSQLFACLLRQGRIDDARELLQRLEAGCRQLPRGAFAEAAFQSSASEFGLELMASSPGDNGEASIAHKRVRLWADLEPKPRPSEQAATGVDRLARGRQAMRGERFQEANLHLDASFEDADDAVAALLFRAECQLRLGDDERAAKLVAQASPRTTHPAGQALRALTQLRLGDPPFEGIEAEWDQGNMFNGFLTYSLPQLVEPQQLAAARRSKEALEQALWTALARFGGNRHRQAMVLKPESPSGLAAFVRPPSARDAAADLLRTLAQRAPSETMALLEKLQEQYPTSPHPHCYLGEMLLWCGEYDQAAAAFEAALGRADARWAYIGLAAVHLLNANLKGASKEMARCDQAYRPLPGATNFVYLGELFRRQGKWALAREALDKSLEGKPGRYTAWVNLALIAHQTGDRDEEERLASYLWREMPGLLVLSARALGLPAEHMQRQHGRVVLWEKSLELSRGNRSSHMYTCFSDEKSGLEDMRILPSGSRARGFLREHWGALVEAELRTVQGAVRLTRRLC